MLRPAAIALAVCFGSFVEAQEAPPAAPPGRSRPAAPVAPAGAGGAVEGEGAGPAGTPTRVPELLARTPEVARISSLLGAEILDMGCQQVGRLEDFVAREDGRLVAILKLPDERLIGLPLSELIARAKPDLEGGSDRVTIRSFKLARESRRLDIAPAVEDKSHLDEAWLVKLDSGSRPAPTPATPAAPNAPDPGAAPATPPPESAPLPLLGALLGRPALDSAGQPIGTIVDVVAGISKARVAYLVVLQREGPDGPESFHAVPFAALEPGGSDAGVRLNIGSDELRRSPRIDGLTRLPADPFPAPAPAAPPTR